MTEACARLNAAARDEAAAMLLGCCGSARWVGKMIDRRPFASRAALHEAAGEVWAGLGPEDHLEAFGRHPRIGDDAPEGRGPAAAWSRDEQSTTARGDADVLARLRAANAAYEARFGFVFLVCATGKTATEILDRLELRMGHDKETELRIAAGEQAKITLLRLDKLST
jgi:OHCU decarboxylase